MLTPKAIKGRPGWWKIDGYIGDKRYRKTFEAPSKKRAEEFARSEYDKHWEAEHIGGQEATFAECAEHYLDQGGSERFLLRLAKYFGDTKVKDIRVSDVSKAARVLYPACGPSATRRQLYVPLNAVIKVASRAGMCPFVFFDPPKEGKTRIDYADMHWQIAFDKKADDDLRLFVKFLQITGARCQEACDVRLRDFRDTGHVAIYMGKTKKERLARTPEEFVLELQDFAAGKGPDDFLFDFTDRTVVNKRLKTACRKAGIRYLSTHQCGRHTFAARLLAQGASLYMVKEAGGWASISVVAEKYGHLERSHVDREIDKLYLSTSQQTVIEDRQSVVIDHE